MDYGKILRRAWEITWRWKVLWILGFLVALGKGASSGSGGSNYSFDGSEWGTTYATPQIQPEIVALIVGLCCLGLIIGIAIWVASIIARGGLIAGVAQVEDEGATTFGQAWRAGASRFWTLFGISILAALPFIILLVGGIVVFVVMIAGGVALSDVSEGGVPLAVFSALCCGGAFCCGMIILGIVMEQIRVYAERAAILEGLGWIEAFQRGWNVLKENLGPTVIFWLVFFGISLVLAVIIGGAMFVTMIPLFGIMANTEPGPWLALPICCGGFLAMVLGGLIGAIVETFSSATWTLAYREMTGMSAAPAEIEALELEPVAE